VSGVVGCYDARTGERKYVGGLELGQSLAPYLLSYGTPMAFFDSGRMITVVSISRIV
jgi:hypothetical protein